MGSQRKSASLRTAFRPLNILVTLIYAFLLLPTLIVIPISFSPTGTLALSHPSLDLYRAFLGDSAWTDALGRSMIVAVCSTAIAILTGVPAAFALNRVLRGRYRTFIGSFLNGTFVGPLVLPTVVIALGIYLLFSPLHVIDSLYGLVFAHAAFIMPYVFVTATSGLKQVEQGAEVAARLMGANWFTIFIRVTLPQMWHSVFSGALLAFLMSFDEVVIAWFITGTSTQTLPVKMYSSIQWEVSPVLAAVSTVLTMGSLLICVAAFFSRSEKPIA
ncbi:ABC transporter permease [Paraburkholderia sp.]|uniref:ABC transporter permease n=1 Tax=Paraburkholderia sp. TaxID=1926495 RepID=UPI0039E4AC0E